VASCLSVGSVGLVSPHHQRILLWHTPHPQVTPEKTVVLVKDSAPLIKLDDKHYKLVDKMEALTLFPPSLVDASSLTVKGPVKFVPGVTIKGDVTIINGQPCLFGCRAASLYGGVSVLGFAAAFSLDDTVRLATRMLCAHSLSCWCACGRDGGATSTEARAIRRHDRHAPKADGWRGTHHFSASSAGLCLMR
jgi:UTP--glucose-1-phosphate uridylyltransferase